jgi:hypothetical protein
MKEKISEEKSSQSQRLAKKVHANKQGLRLRFYSP